jgi:hypothetical protein
MLELIAALLRKLEPNAHPAQNSKEYHALNGALYEIQVPREGC